MLIMRNTKYGSKRTGNIATGNEERAINELRRSVALIVTEGRSWKIAQLLRVCYNIIIIIR